MIGMRKNHRNGQQLKQEQGMVANGISWTPERSDNPILNQVSCELNKGNFYGIIGPNGSGKTTLIKHMMGFLDANEGDITLQGQSVRKYKRGELAKSVSLVPQNTKLDCAYKSKDIVMMGRAPYQKRFSDATKEDWESVFRAMEMTDCKGFMDKEVSILSGGESQRVVTARAIAQETEWIILDEPTASLDIKHQMELMSTLSTLHQNGKKSIVAVLHDINMAVTYCSHIIMMKDGTVYAEGKTSEVMTCENLTQVYGVQFEELNRESSGKTLFFPL